MAFCEGQSVKIKCRGNLRKSNAPFRWSPAPYPIHCNEYPVNVEAGEQAHKSQPAIVVNLMHILGDAYTNFR